MYEYRKLTPEERQEIVQERLAKGHPPHQPPHLLRQNATFLVTAACYNHKPYMHSNERRDMLLDLILQQLADRNIIAFSWVVLINHYHLMLHLPDINSLGDMLRIVHGSTARSWNLEDQISGRKVWYRYSDRMIRSERHYFTTLNYIHYNPVRHGLVDSPYDWKWSSLHWYLAEHGRSWLQDVWRSYPLKDYGEGWDDI